MESVNSIYISYKFCTHLLGTHEKLVLVIAFMVGTARQRREGSENLSFMTLFPIWIFYYMPVFSLIIISRKCGIPKM